MADGKRNSGWFWQAEILTIVVLTLLFTYDQFRRHQQLNDVQQGVELITGLSGDELRCRLLMKKSTGNSKYYGDDCLGDMGGKDGLRRLEKMARDKR